MAAGKQSGSEDADGGEFARKVDRVRDNVKQMAAAASETAAESVSSLADQGADRVKAVAAQVPDVGLWSEDQLAYARERIRAEPIKMVAIAAGVGALFSFLFLRR